MDEKKDELLNPDDFADDEKQADKEVEKSDKDVAAKDNDSSDESKKKAADLSKEEEEQKKKNAEYAKKRREQEEAERKKREAQIREEVKREVELGIYKTNTFTNEPIKDEEDLEVFKIMKELENEGLDPINDFPKRVAKLNKERKAETLKEQENAKKQREAFDKDIAEFVKLHPEVNLKELANDNEFIEFSNGKTGRWTTAEIYEAYMKEKTYKQAAEKEKAEKEHIDKQAADITSTPPTNQSKLPKNTDDIDNINDIESYKAYMSKKYNA